MILIADSGSTKTDWRSLDSAGKIQQAKTPGFNPFHQKAEGLERMLREELLPQINGTVSQVYFYGAGCANQAVAQTVVQALQAVFPEADCEVRSDLWAAARVLCGHEPGIACILGTGANSCQYDGSKITNNVPPLGYILGDEGSGAYLGKELLNRYLKRDMPVRLAQHFAKRYEVTTDAVLDRVYRQPQANTYLASFAKFAFHHRKEPYIMRMIYGGFEAFFDKNVCRYPEFQQQKVHFTGSIAFYHSNILRQVANDRGIRVQNILESPIAGLTLYHQNH